MPNEELNSNSLQEYISLRKKEISNITRGKQISFFGSSAGSIILTYVFGLENQVSEVIDDNESRHGKYMPGTGARVLAPHPGINKMTRFALTLPGGLGHD